MSRTTAFQRIVSLLVRPASAHCDTEDGPAAIDGRKALDAGNVNIALKWVLPDGEAEVARAFEQARRVRELGGEAAEVADRWFLETLIRVHRLSEGVGFAGIKPSGTGVTPPVAAADAAIAEGSIDPLRGLVDDARWAELERRFDRAIGLRDFDDDDLMAARAYMGAYVAFFKYAEGHDHDHGQHGRQGHGHQVAAR
jgi:hypothetical protein